MKHAGSKYNGTQNFVNQSFKMNDYLSTVVIYHAQTKRSVVFQKDQTTTMKKVDEFHLADPNDIEKTKKQIFKINKNVITC